MLDLDRDYWPRYCEENVWRLCGRLPAGLAGALVVFISNPSARVALWCQRASRSGEIVWDYHVILLVQDETGWRVFDADSRLPQPLDAACYLSQTFRPLGEALADQRPRFRIVDAAEYRSALRSDRSHMRRPDGGWLSGPPPWPRIGSGSNLMRFVDVEAPYRGEVCDLRGLRRRLGL